MKSSGADHGLREHNGTFRKPLKVIALRRVIDDDRMDEPGGGLVHVPEPVQRAVPFANEDAFLALVGIRGDYGDKDVAGGNVLLNDRPPRIAGLKASFVKPRIQARATEAGLQPLDRPRSGWRS